MRIAQLIGIVVFTIVAVWYGPLLSKLLRADALALLLWVHVFRYSAVFAISAQHQGFPISDRAVFEIVAGDLLGAALALIAIFLLRSRSTFGIFASWLVVVETLVDFGVAAHRRRLEPLTMEPTGVLALVLSFLVPMVLVSLPVIVWQLIYRRRESLAAVAR